MYYQLINVKDGCIGIVWQFKKGKPQIESIFLPCSHSQMVTKIKKQYPGISETGQEISGGLTKSVAGIYEGKRTHFDLSLLNWKKLTPFAAKVLRTTCKIPHGKVDTYSGLAAKSLSPRAARAVGTAMANNPFPLVVPCHRVVRSDGSLGGFGGGLGMKKELLQREGVAQDKRGRIPVTFFS